MCTGKGIAAVTGRCPCRLKTQEVDPMPLHDDSRLLSAESSPKGAVIRFVPPSVSLDDSNAPLLGALLTHFLDGGEE